MRVCFQIDVETSQVAGVWWEIGDFTDQTLDCAYVDPISMVALLGIETMMRRPPTMSWHAYWAHLASRVSPTQWWEVAEVDNESYAYELLFKTWTCHPRTSGEAMEETLEVTGPPSDSHRRRH